MPHKHQLFSRGNRSQVSLATQEANDKRSYVESPLHSPAFPPQLDPSSHYDHEKGEQNYGLPYRSEEARFYQLGSPQRSQSQRLPSLINTNQPTIHLVAPHNSASTPSSAIEDNPDRYYQQGPQGPSPPAIKAEPKKRRFFGIGSSSSAKVSGKGTGTPPQKLGRSISVRRKEQIDPQTYADAGVRTAHQRWSTSEPPAEEAEKEEEEEEGGSSPHFTHPYYSASSSQPLDRDPLKFPAFPPSLPHEDYVHNKSQQGGLPSSSARYSLSRQSSNQSRWEKAAQQDQKYSRSDSQQTPSSYHPSPSSATSTSSHSFAHRAPNEALHQYHKDSGNRPPSQQSLEPPPPVHHPRTSEPYLSKQGPSYVQGSMGPPSTQQPPPNRRSSESTQQSQVSSGREGGVYQPYSQGIQQGQVLPSNAPPQYSAQLVPQGQTYRGTSQPSPMAQQHSDQGRSTPPPSRSRDDVSILDSGQLLARHDELQDKYRKVKKYYFDKDAQVQQLQNTLAHQRLAQSRTSLDDNEYSNRFQRLDGAINNLAFNIRRDWRSVPPWLAPHVNREAATQPTKEMTAVGRACISRWLVDELLERYFHPALDPVFSAELKIIEKNLRRFAAPTPSDEEKDALLARISNWRLSTLDGLQEILASAQAAENRNTLTEGLIEKLTNSLLGMLKDPPPPGLEGGVSMIVELAVGIAANLPMESRDVFVEYVTPGAPLNEAHMKIETGLPALTNPGEGLDGDTASLVSKPTEDTGSIESKDTAISNSASGEEAAKQEAAMQQQPVPGKKKGMFGGLMGNSGIKKGSTAGAAGISGGQTSPQGPQQQQQGPSKEERVRFSTFMAVEVRGRSVLVKAPVYVRE